MFVKKRWKEGLIIIGIGMVIFLNQPVNSLIVREVAKNKVIAIKKLRGKDVVVLSHINSIYDVEVREIFEVRGNFFVLKKVETSSWGVREYYGIADNFIERRFSKIPFRNTTDRNFIFSVNGENVKEILKFRDRSLLVEVNSIKRGEYYWKKLMTKLNKEVLP